MIKLNERQASIQPVKSKLKVSILDDREISEINQNTRTVLEEIGIIFPSEKALKIFADVGADVDFENQLVKIAPDLLDKYLAQGRSTKASLNSRFKAGTGCTRRQRKWHLFLLQR